AAHFQGHVDEVCGAVISPDKALLASASRDAKVKLWEVRTGKELATLSVLKKATLSAIACSPDGKTLAAVGGISDPSGYGGEATVWDLETRCLRFTLSGHTSPVTSVAFSADGKTLATGDYAGRVRLWYPRTGRLRSVF